MTDALERYAPSGRVAVHALVALPLAHTIAAGFGFGYQKLLDASPYVVLHIFFPVVLAAVLAFVTIQSLRVGHVRKSSLAYAVGASMACVALLAAHFVYEWSAPDGRQASLRVTACVLEALTTIGICAFVVRDWFRRAVYSELDRHYVPRRLLGKAWGRDVLSVRRSAGERGVTALLDCGLRAKPSESDQGEFRFWLREDTERAWLTLWWHGQMKGLRDKKVRRDVLVLRRVVTDRSVVEQLRSIVAPADS